MSVRVPEEVLMCASEVTRLSLGRKVPDVDLGLAFDSMDGVEEFVDAHATLFTSVTGLFRRALDALK